jgi:quercetin dioxygenase-like cupin family protein
MATARLPALLGLCHAATVIPFIHPERREGLFGGRGFVLVESLVGELCAPFTVALHCELSPHGSVGEHVQSTEDELCIVLSGEGTLHVQGVPRRVSAGSVVGLSVGQSLAIENTTGAPLRYLIVKAVSAPKTV